MIFNENKKSHIDKEAFRILGLFETTTEKKTKQNDEKGSIAHQIPQRIIDDKIELAYLVKASLFDKTNAIKECYNGKCVGLNHDNYKELEKLANTIYKDKEINSRISKTFIEQKLWDWLLKTFKNQKADLNFSSYILNEMEESIEHLKVFYPMLYLNIGNPFQIGNVKFEFFTKDFFDSLTKQYQKDNPHMLTNPYEDMRKEYQGHVFVSYEVNAEIEKAKSIALEECSLAVDILKMCSDTTDIPQLKLSFDIDNRTRENIKNQIIITRPKKIEPSFEINFYRLPSQHLIHDQEWSRIVHRQIGIFHNFLISLTDEKTELEQLIINAIKRYANAISNSNQHQRIVELFTILESLLLADKNSPIIESVCKYCSKLVFKGANERRDVISMLKTMYEVRSDFIHHAKESAFELDNLHKLQKTVYILVLKLIQKTSLHKNKQTLLHEIDDAILKAY